MEEVVRLTSLALAAVAEAKDTARLREVELEFLGKSGSISGLMRGIGALPAEERKGFGEAVNQARIEVETALVSRRRALREGELQAQFANEALDVTMPGRAPNAGLVHVLQQTIDEIKRIMGGMGFEYHESPELEEFRYNFDALNYPPNHPAMDEQDTFYISDEVLLRTQCTALQGRVFEQRKPPFRVFTVGRTFRNEAVDRTHGHTFYQVDAFMVDEGISMAHLKGTLAAFVRGMLGDEVTVRFRPDFFPFVEPGVDYAISSPRLFDGRWVELGGAGLIHNNILRRYGIDTERYSGFAFGLGVERMPMMKHGVDDLRYFFENDLRFLRQFA
ncbi:MAG: phenylalanine--tRNA ligase subunit alpha [Fimbriimonadaceae bacterium]|nr:phenylalanine--tRNA ligase subunit alpha [Fimbriimonadaceae bacterium]